MKGTAVGPVLECIIQGAPIPRLVWPIRDDQNVHCAALQSPDATIAASRCHCDAPSLAMLTSPGGGVYGRVVLSRASHPMDGSPSGHVDARRDIWTETGEPRKVVPWSSPQRLHTCPDAIFVLLIRVNMPRMLTEPLVLRSEVHGMERCHQLLICAMPGFVTCTRFDHNQTKSSFQQQQTSKILHIGSSCRAAERGLQQYI